MILTIDQRDQWFMMGYFVGHGWIEEPDTIKFSIEITDHKDYILQRINQILKLTEEYSCTHIDWYQILQQFGTRVPEWVQDAPKELIQEFLEGYRMTTVGTHTHDWLLGIQRLYIKIGYMDEWDVVIEDHYMWFAVTYMVFTQSVTHATNVYNFEVDVDNSYTVENAVVHNCQSFSNAGKKLAFSDKRGLLFDNIVTILNQHHTPLALLENVKHIKKVSNGTVHHYIYEQLHSIGYQVFDLGLSPTDLGIPQNRERVLFVVVRNDLYNEHNKTTISDPIGKTQS